MWNERVACPRARRRQFVCGSCDPHHLRSRVFTQYVLSYTRMIRITYPDVTHRAVKADTTPFARTLTYVN